jgi:hypothetical protein
LWGGLCPDGTGRRPAIEPDWATGRTESFGLIVRRAIQKIYEWVEVPWILEGQDPPQLQA